MDEPCFLFSDDYGNSYLTGASFRKRPQQPLHLTLAIESSSESCETPAVSVVRDKLQPQVHSSQKEAVKARAQVLGTDRGYVHREWDWVYEIGTGTRYDDGWA